MKHTKRILAAILAVGVLCGVCLAAMGPGNATEQEPVQSPVVQTLAAQSASPGFTDVPQNAWYAEAASYVRDNGVMNGTSATTFGPDLTMTRSMLATVLYRAAGSPAVTGADSFTDTEDGAYYADAVLWASANGIVSGYGNGLFGTNDPVSREQIATILWRYDGSETGAASAGFTDSAAIGSYAVEAVNWAVDQGIVTGLSDGSFFPKGNATRAQVAVMLFRYLTGGAAEPTTPQPETPAPTPDASTPAVYMTTDISSVGLMAIYEALGADPSGNVAVKLSTGETGSNYLRTDLIGELVQSLDATIVECNTAYGGQRASTAMHRQLAEDHGYTAIADVDIMDADGSMTLPVEGGSNLTENYVGAHFANYDYFVVLSHFKGHAMGGFGGAIKNISIGIASSEGKNHIHTAGQGGSMWGAPQDPFLESMAEAGKSVSDSLDGNILYINVMNSLSVDCDCDGNPAEPDMHDIGILASFDPVALDQACVDLVYAAPDGGSLVRRIESRNGIHTLEHAAEIGLGSRTYDLVSIDN